MQPAVVLDTNVILDCWHFHDRRAQALREHIEAGALRVLSNASINDELRDVLSRSAFVANSAAVLQRWLALSECVQTLGPAPWRCRDPNDQTFLDLAYSHQAQALITKDNALLALTKKAAAMQAPYRPLRIGRPEQLAVGQVLVHPA